MYFILAPTGHQEHLQRSNSFNWTDHPRAFSTWNCALQGVRHRQWPVWYSQVTQEVSRRYSLAGRRWPFPCRAAFPKLQKHTPELMSSLILHPSEGAQSLSDLATMLLLLLGMAYLIRR